MNIDKKCDRCEQLLIYNVYIHDVNKENKPEIV